MVPGFLAEVSAEDSIMLHAPAILCAVCLHVMAASACGLKAIHRCWLSIALTLSWLSRKMRRCAPKRAMRCLAQVELARLHREAAQRAAAAAQHQRAAAAVAQATTQAAARPDGWGMAAVANGAAAPPAANEQLLRSLKVSWYLKV